MELIIGGLAIAVGFGALALYAVKSGIAPLRPPLEVRRDKYPVAFWLLVLVYSAVSVFGVWFMFVSLQAQR